MSGYRPADMGVVPELAALSLVLTAAGLALTRARSRLALVFSWLVLTAGALTAHLVTRQEPAGLRMLAICAALFLGMKAVVGTSDLLEHAPLPPARWLAFALGWPGMRPRVFAEREASARGAARLLRRGALRLSIGAVVVVVARALPPFLGRWPAMLLLVAGLSLVVHFGLFNVAAGLWRHAGFWADALFRSPLSSSSLSEFWSRRWNVAFSEMTQLSIHAPLRRRSGPAAALLAAFVFSGLLHEAAITLPTHGPYGRPLLYFAVEGALVLVERAPRVSNALHANGTLAHVWTLAAVALPLPLLWTPPFVRDVLWPLLG